MGDIPAGHDAWVVGNEPVHILDFAGNSDAIGMPREHERIVTTLLMTDIVDSTRSADRLGDGAWSRSSPITTGWCAPNCSGSAARRSIPLATASWPPSGAR